MKFSKNANDNKNLKDDELKSKDEVKQENLQQEEDKILKNSSGNGESDLQENQKGDQQVTDKDFNFEINQKGEHDFHEDNHLEDPKKRKLKFEIKKLHEETKKLQEEVHIKQERINTLEAQINHINDNFKNEVIKKGQEAQIKLDQKIKEYQSKYETELKHNRKYALKNAAIELIDIISNFELAVNSKTNNPEIANYLKGFQMFVGMFKNYLSQNGITEIIVNVNDNFNAEVMHAMETEKKEGTEPHKVLKVIKKGYKLHDIVIVPATVIVSE